MGATGICKVKILRMANGLKNDQRMTERKLNPWVAFLSVGRILLKPRQPVI